MDAICEHLEAVTRGEIQRLLINIPPGHAKSLLVAVLWPAWVWTQRPEWRAIFTSHAEKLALRDSVRSRAVIESDWYLEQFSVPDGWELSGDQNAKGYYTNTRSGMRMALGVGSGATGFRANAIVTDDPIAATAAHSKLARDEVARWWDEEMSMRLDDQHRDARVIIMQRLHDEDLSGHVLRQGGYEHLCLPSEFDSRRRAITYRTVKNGRAMREELFRDPRQADDELLFEALFPADVLAQAKVDLRASGYAGQHQQAPSPVGGGLFKRRWWRFWKPDGTAPNCDACRPYGCSPDPARPLPTIERHIISLDAAFKDASTGSYVVFQVWGCNQADRFLLAQARGRWSFTMTLAQFRVLSQAWPFARRKIVEDKANGPAIIDTLRSEIAGIIAVNPEGGKEARASAMQPQVESGNVYLPDGAAWLEDFVEELGLFPYGRNDDQVDCMTQALLDLSASPEVTRARAMANL